MLRILTGFWGHIVVIRQKEDTLHTWFAELAASFERHTYRFQLPLWALFPGMNIWHTSDPANVKYILKDNFENYLKGPIFRANMDDLLGDGIFNAGLKSFLPLRYAVNVPSSFHETSESCDRPHSTATHNSLSETVTRSS